MFFGEAFLQCMPVFLQPYQHILKHTHSAVAACFLIDLSPAIGVRLGRTTDKQGQGAHIPL